MEITFLMEKKLAFSFSMKLPNYFARFLYIVQRAFDYVEGVHEQNKKKEEPHAHGRRRDRN
jgi:hypothetical protein